jgi:hypothetical protein
MRGRRFDEASAWPGDYMREPGLTRRGVLHGAAVIGAAAVLPRDLLAVQSHGAVAAPARFPGRVGATVSPTAMGVRTWREGARKFDAAASCPLAATAARMYWSGAGFHTGPGLRMVRAMAAVGVATVLSFRPSRHHQPSEIISLRDSIRRCLAAGLNIEAVGLWHEPNDITQHPHPFRSPQAYRDYVRYYGPTVVEMGIPLAYIPLVLTTRGVLQHDYFPGASHNGKRLVSHIYADYYCRGEFRRGVRIEAPIMLADNHGLKLGLGEFGRTTGPYHVSDREFEAYMDYLTRVFAPRRDRASCIYFAAGPWNVPSPRGYAALRAFHQALAG